MDPEILILSDGRSHSDGSIGVSLVPPAPAAPWHVLHPRDVLVYKSLPVGSTELELEELTEELELDEESLLAVWLEALDSLLEELASLLDEEVAELGTGLPLKVSGWPPQADNVRIIVPTKKPAKGSLLIPIICLARKIKK